VTTFVDTSGLFALIDVDSATHSRASAAWRALRDSRDDLVTTNYVVVETLSVLQNRLGLAAARDFVDQVAPLLAVEWVDAGLHWAAITAVLAANRRTLSLVDCSSFEMMWRLGITRAFALDEHFREQGFEVVP
jgi:predicted nucleic acid-binding protein